MKLPIIIAGGLLLATSACKTTYKATDNPMPAKDSTNSSSTMDTSSTAINKTPASTDTSMIANIDSTRIDSMGQAMPDSAKINAATDSVLVNQSSDSVISKMDSTTKQSMPDTTINQMAADSSAVNAQAPATVEPIFNKQYPGATNVVWTAYDSLAAIPIDMRLTGWKKMDAEDHMVKFDFEDETYYAWYDSNGKWIGSAAPMTDISKLPAAVSTAVKNAIKTRYSGYTISQVNREFQDGKKSYEVELTKDDSKVRMLVSSAGKITQIFKYAAEKK